MKELVNKISSYNFINYLLPGILFVILTSYITNYNLVLKDNMIGFFFYYFIGMTISRIGSLIIEPTLKRIGLLKFSEYKRFVVASGKDDQIALFSEINNMYRSIIAMLVMVVLAKGYEFIDIKLGLYNWINFLLNAIILLSIYILSYRKQTEYISKRIGLTEEDLENISDDQIDQ